jgi:Zn-dependent M28 family amino/carboxypeptidase
VAAALELARRLEAHPPSGLDVWVVFTGAAEGLMLGMREWLRGHADELDPRRTFFLNLDAIGSGKPRAVAAEGYVTIYQHDPRLARLADARSSSPPLVLRQGTDGVLPAMRGFPSLTLCCTDEYDRIANQRRQTDTLDGVDPRSAEAAVAVAEEVVRGIDSGLLPALLPTLREERPQSGTTGGSGV